MDFSFLKNYLDLLPYLIAAFIGVFLLTPFIGKIANWLGAIDLPATLRSRTDRTKDQRLHTIPKPRLGGVGIISIFLLITIISGNLTSEMIGILLGALILLIFGILDDKFELGPRSQILGHLLAAISAVVAGITIQNINIGGFSPNLDLFSLELLNLDFLKYTFVFPADLITIIWILVLINALNWMCGIDGLGESITAITSLALVFIAFETGNPAIAMMSVILLGSVLGFLPFNFPPSKILGGTAGDTNFGFLLSTLAIMSSAKLSTTLLLLSIPILDMIYVLVRRIFEHKVANPIKLMGISGSIHLHHRLINFGFTKKHTLYMEISLFAIFALIALFFEGVGNDVFYLHIVLISLFSIFIFLSFIVKINEKRRKKRKEIKRGKVVRDVSPEERYRY